MANLKERQKAEAVKRMKKLNIMEQAIEDFVSDDKLNLSENHGMLYWLNDNEQAIVDKFNKKFGDLVYHVIHEFTNIGELYCLLYVSQYEEEWKEDEQNLNEGQTYAYVVNKNSPDSVDIGAIGVKPMNGGVERTW